MDNQNSKHTKLTPSERKALKARLENLSQNEKLSPEDRAEAGRRAKNLSETPKDRAALEADYRAVAAQCAELSAKKRILLFRKIISWIAGIISWVAFLLIAQYLLNSLNIETYKDFDPPVWTYRYGRYGDYELIDGDFTAIGSAVNILSIMFSYRIGTAIYKWHWQGGISKAGNVDFLAWTYGLLAYVISSALLTKISRYFDLHPDWLFILVELPILVTLFLYLRSWRTKKLEPQRRRERREKDSSV